MFSPIDGPLDGLYYLWTLNNTGMRIPIHVYDIHQCSH